MCSVGERGHGRGGAGQPPTPPPGGLAAPSLPAAIYAVAYSSIALLPIAACLSFPSSADADRVAAHAALAVVGLGHGGAALLAAVSGVLLPFEPPYRSVANPLAVPALADLHGATATVRDGLAT